MRFNNLFVIVAALAPTIAWAEPTIVVNAGEEPETKAWTQPASLNFTSNGDGKDSWSLDLAGKYEDAIGSTSHTGLVRVIAQRNTQLKKEVENYALELGAKLDLSTATGPGPDQDAWYFPTKISLAWADKTVFPDPKAVCDGLPPQPSDCFEQHEKSLRAIVSTLLFRSSWEDSIAWKDSTHTEVVGPPWGWTHSFLPTVTFFYDELLDAKPDALGVEPDGGVLGGKFAVSVATSPRFSDYRLIISANLQEIIAFDRSSGRKANFARESTQVKISVDYEFGQRSYLSGAGWIPALGISYTHGDDPLTGKLDQDNTVVGLRVTYRGE